MCKNYEIFLILYPSQKSVEDEIMYVLDDGTEMTEDEFHAKFEKVTPTQQEEEKENKVQEGHKEQEHEEGHEEQSHHHYGEKDAEKVKLRIFL